MTTAVEPREHAVDARGLRFHYVEWGPPDAPPIVLLHGMSAMCRIWDRLALPLQDRYRLFALDQRGHGDTSWPDEPAYAAADYLADLEALIDAWGLERFTLIGLSMGAMNALAYAARDPHRVARLVSVDIRPAFDYTKRASYELDRHVAHNGHPTFDDEESAFRALRVAKQTTPDQQLRHHARHLVRRTDDGRWTFKHDPRASFYWRPADLWDELAKIAAPALIVRGGKSQVLSEGVAAKMRDAFPRAELLTIEDAGHTVPEDASAAFNRAVEDFLARYPD